MRVYAATRIAPAHRVTTATCVAVTAGLGILNGSGFGGEINVRDPFPSNVLPLTFNAIGIVLGVSSDRGVPPLSQAR